MTQTLKRSRPEAVTSFTQILNGVFFTRRASRTLTSFQRTRYEISSRDQRQTPSGGKEGSGGYLGFIQAFGGLARLRAKRRNRASVNRTKANEALYRTVNIEPLLLQPCDYFGAALAARKGSGGKAWNPTAFFPTPHHLVELMTQLTMSQEDDLRSKKVSDPALGTGRMLLHASNYSLRLYGQDIDPLVVKISKINGALYAPWMSFPLPALFFGNDVPQLNDTTFEADVQVYPLNARTQGTLF